MSVKFAITATITTLVGGELHEAQYYIGTRRQPLTYAGAARIIQKDLKNLVEVVRLDHVSVI